MIIDVRLNSVDRIKAKIEELIERIDIHSLCTVFPEISALINWETMEIEGGTKITQ